MKNSGHATQLRQRLVEHIATGGSLAAFARKNPERSERQYRRWASEASFKDRVRRQSAEITQTIVRQLTAVSAMAASELGRLLQDKDPAIRLGASRTALRVLVAIRKHADHDQRISELEEIARNGKHRETPH